MLNNLLKAKLRKTAETMMAKGKGLLAADESIGTVDKRFKPIGLENTEENRRAFRDMLLTTPGIGEYISSVILFDETIRQESFSGKPFVEVLKAAGVLPGIKVDQGTVSMPLSPTEKLTKGLEGLDSRLKEYVLLGATFCKWRAVITIDEVAPTDENILQNAKDLTEYANICQQNGLVPVVEPEVLMDGSHTRKEAKQASERILTVLFDELKKKNLLLEGLILKTSMVISGKDSNEDESSQDIATETIDLFKNVLPKNLAGQAFLSGGQKEVQATENLNAMHQLGILPWPITFSFARALQDSATKTWGGKKENIEMAQKIFLHRAKMNSLASLGKYQAEMEQEAL